MDTVTFQKLGTLGSGSYSKVYNVKSPDGGNRALKVNLKYREQDSNACYKELQNNIVFSSHPFIMKMLYHFRGEPFSEDVRSPTRDADDKYDGIHFAYNIMKGSLMDYSRTNILSANNMKRFIIQISLALEYMHDSGYIHRDVKPENILVSGHGEELVFKLGDLGFCKMFFEYDYPHTPEISTPRYCAPECLLLGSNYDKSIDLWSFGCSIYTIYMGRTIIQNKKVRTFNATLLELIECLPYPLPLEIDRNGKVKRNMNVSTVPKLSINKFFSNPRMVDISSYDANGIEDIIMGFVTFDPKERISLEACLNTDIFDEHVSMIDETRSSNNLPVPQPSNFVIYDGETRRILMKRVREIYDKRKNIRWYSHKLLFQLVDHCDRIISELPPHVNGGNDVVLASFMSILYVLVKSYTKPDPVIYSMIDILPMKWRTPKFIELASSTDLELTIVELVLKCQITTMTIYNYACTIGRPFESEILQMLEFVLAGKHAGMNERDAYNLIMST